MQSRTFHDQKGAHTLAALGGVPHALRHCTVAKRCQDLIEMSLNRGCNSRPCILHGVY